MAAFLEQMSTLPKDAVLTSGIGSALTATVKDIRSFTEKKNPQVMPLKDSENKVKGKVTLSNVSWFQGSMTLSQALTRDLGQGETRLGLVNKCLGLLEHRGMGVEASLKNKAASLNKK